MTETTIKEEKFQGKVSPKIQQGDTVKIVDSEKNTNLTYTVKKIKRMYDGTIFYLLETESSPVKLLYYDSEKSHLEKV